MGLHTSHEAIDTLVALLRNEITRLYRVSTKVKDKVDPLKGVSGALPSQVTKLGDKVKVSAGMNDTGL